MNAGRRFILGRDTRRRRWPAYSDRRLRPILFHPIAFRNRCRRKRFAWLGWHRCGLRFANTSPAIQAHMKRWDIW